MAGFPARQARRGDRPGRDLGGDRARASNASGRALGELLPGAEAFDEPPEPAGVVVHRIEAMGDGFSIEPETDGAFRVRGRRIERIAAQTNFEVEESAERFQRDLSRLGIDAELRRAGISPGDIVRIGSTELEWEPQPWERP